MIYPFLRTLLFFLPAEFSHHFSLKSLNLLYKWRLIRPKKIHNQPVSMMGLTFPNRVGLAAGLDKNGDYIDALAALGFGAIEVGTVTPKPQPGNPKPRLFRITKAQALINRLGFNNQGVDYLCRQLESISYKGILGINIGKNFSTPLENATQDYVLAFNKVYRYASYVVINISSPNTPGLRQLHYGADLENLLAELKNSQAQLAQQHSKYVPLVIKIAPDLTKDQIMELATALLTHKIDGVIATNTTLSRDRVSHLKHGDEQGGLSGRPLFHKSLTVIQQLYHVLQEDIPIIGCGGIAGEDDMEQMLQAGAKIVQVYTGFIYQGPNLIRKLGSHSNHG